MDFSMYILPKESAQAALGLSEEGLYSVNHTEEISYVLLIQVSITLPR